MIKKALIAGAVMLAALSPPATAHEGGRDPNGVLYNKCHEVLGFQRVPAHRAEALVPDRYGVDPDRDGVADFYVSTRRCETVTVNGMTVSNAIDSHISIVIDPPGNDPDEPDAAPHPSFLFPWKAADHDLAHDLSPLDVYLVQWVANNRPFADWMRATTGLGDRVKVVRSLTFESNRATEISREVLRLQVPRPAPSPFHIDATLQEVATVPSPLDVAENWWADTDDGTVIIHAENLRSGDPHLLVGVGTIKGTLTSDDPDSPLGRLFGEEQQRPLCAGPNPDAPEGKILPCPHEVGDVFGSVSGVEGVQLTKCVRTASNPCSHDAH